MQVAFADDLITVATIKMKAETWSKNNLTYVGVWINWIILLKTYPRDGKEE